jgi:bidirectional [NiFe] hydrogenase diaphorase subunit
MIGRVVTLKIDGKDVSGRSDESVLDIARENGVHIPTLCALEGVSVAGACRMCLVEIKGMNKLLPACATTVWEGMEVVTASERLSKYRRMTVEMMFVEGNHVCAVCVSNGHCELQDQAVEQGIDHISLPYMYPKREVDASHDLFGLDANRCILCTRCVRVCDEVEGAHVWDVMSRGIESKVITDFATPWGESEACTSCGKCVQSCPTGALFTKGVSVGEMNKHSEFLAPLVAMRGRRK